VVRLKIALTGGGTGGHIYPALSLWSYLHAKHPEATALYIGTSKGLEKDIVSHTDLPFVEVSAAGLQRQLSVSAVKTAVTTLKGYFEAKRALKSFQPDVVVGMGGYVTLPVMYAANSLHIPSVIWEGNARPGLTNQLCARKVDAVALCFDGGETWFRGARKLVVTGNPRASEVLSVTAQQKKEAREKYHILANQKLILIYMGSRGAGTVNRVITELLPKFAIRPDWRVMFVTGDRDFETTLASIGELPPHITLHPFLYDMAHILPCSDVVISRAGSATLSEICALGIASILIPSPYVTANHQEENAKRLSLRMAAAMIRESELTTDGLWVQLENMLDHELGKTMAAHALALSTPKAVQNLYDLVMAASTQTING
jgi:UDP-N-acetylglucosamine--N-acetylmuramyl-(pentapeptide) pyrophosphoryl-undecaprenol N-acetylglucosamine transferase